MQTVNVEQVNFRSFGLVSGAMVVGIFGLLLPSLFGNEINVESWPFYLAAVLAGVALVVPSFLEPVYKVWMRFGAVMGAINTRIILGILFFMVFTPMALIMFVIRRDTMHRAYDSNVSTYRVKSVNRAPSHLERPY